VGDWSTYGLSDFLMFSPQAYWRLVERHNLAWWPAQLVALACGLALLAALRRQAQRPALVVLAVAWAWVGWAFHWQRYAEIFIAAPWLAAACWLQSALLLAALVVPQPEGRAGTNALGQIGLALAAIALAYPLLAALESHPWLQAEVFGFMPDPTALATLGALLALRGLPPWSRVLLAVLPAAALVLGGLTRWLIA
jgi:hypothetical protein